MAMEEKQTKPLKSPKPVEKNENAGNIFFFFFNISIFTLIEKLVFPDDSSSPLPKDREAMTDDHLSAQFEATGE